MPRAAMSVATSTRTSPIAKAGESALALGLRLVAVNGGRPRSRRGEMPHDAVGAVLGAGETSTRVEVRVLQQDREQVPLALARHENDALLDLFDRRRRRRDRRPSPDRPGSLGQSGDRRRHRRREQQCLAAQRQQPDDPPTRE